MRLHLNRRDHPNLTSFEKFDRLKISRNRDRVFDIPCQPNLIVFCFYFFNLHMILIVKKNKVISNILVTDLVFLLVQNILISECFGVPFWGCTVHI